MNEPICLEPINFADLESPDPQVRRTTNEVVAHNERKLYGKVTQATEKVLRNLDVEQGLEPTGDSADNLPA